ncbi:hypothetical protein [Kordia sp.]|uniref:hypothetical protein n=1 Tax=Kordia sp. TaxID=1965332 RepID=UPI003D6A89D3
MKKRSLKSLHLNKRTVSNFKHHNIRGGYASDNLNGSCTGGGSTAPLPTKTCEWPTEKCTDGFVCSSAICIAKSEDAIICFSIRASNEC